MDERENVTEVEGNLTDLDRLLIEGHDAVVQGVQRALQERNAKVRAEIERAHGLHPGSLGTAYRIDLDAGRIVPNKNGHPVEPVMTPQE